MTAPRFTVVMATYGRGRHILPSVRSVLGQSLAEFELLVVGDACTDETAAVVGAVGDPRVRWLNLPARCGSQSGPNNAGIAAARAGLIAYLGHDDIWEPDHLARHAAIFAGESADFVVSGAIFHLPNGLPGSSVTGLFASDEDLSPYFFPPSSFSHRRAALERIGGWRMPMEIRAPVDEDLLLRAVDAGLDFRSTGAVGVHKFAAGHRYLSYVRQESDEQESMLADLALPGHAGRVAALVAEARALGSFMVKSDRTFDAFAPGELARRNAARKGLRLAASRPLGSGVTLRHAREDSVFDWKTHPVLGFRRHKANPHPRLLLPVLGGRARLSFAVACKDRAALGPIELMCNGESLVARAGWVWPGLVAWFARYQVDIMLLPDRPSLVEFRLSEMQRPIPRKRRLAVGPLRISPI